MIKQHWFDGWTMLKPYFFDCPGGLWPLPCYPWIRMVQKPSQPWTGGIPAGEALRWKSAHALRQHGGTQNMICNIYIYINTTYIHNIYNHIYVFIYILIVVDVFLDGNMFCFFCLWGRWWYTIESWGFKNAATASNGCWNVMFTLFGWCVNGTFHYPRDEDRSTCENTKAMCLQYVGKHLFGRYTGHLSPLKEEYNMTSYIVVQNPSEY